MTSAKQQIHCMQVRAQKQANMVTHLRSGPHMGLGLAVQRLLENTWQKAHIQKENGIQKYYEETKAGRFSKWIIHEYRDLVLF